MPSAVSIFFDTPMKGQMPRNWEKIKLFTRIAPSEIVNRLVSIYFAASSLFFVSIRFSIHWEKAMTNARMMKPPTGRIRSRQG